MGGIILVYNYFSQGSKATMPNIRPPLVSLYDGCFEPSGELPGPGHTLRAGGNLTA